MRNNLPRDANLLYVWYKAKVSEVHLAEMRISIQKRSSIRVDSELAALCCKG